MGLVVWAGVCLATALVLRRRPFVAAVVGLVLWCLVPGVAGHHLTGSTSGLSQTHPAAVYVLVVAAVQLASGSAELRLALAYRRVWAWTALFVVGVAMATGLAFVAGSGRWAAVANQLLGPLVLFFLVGGCLLVDPGRVSRLIRVVIVLAAVEAAVSILQLVTQSPLLFTSDYERQYWFDESFNRWMGTFDHPLILSLFLACSVFLLAELDRWWLVLPLVALDLGGLLTTQSRTGFAIGLLGFGYLLYASRSGVAGRAALLTLGTAAGFVAYRAGAADGLLSRISDDTGSSVAREEALAYVANHWQEYVVSGRGLDSSFAVARSVGLDTSFESALLMYVIDLGLVTATVYFALMIGVIAAGRRRGSGVAAAVATGALFIVQTFSGLSGVTATPAILWTALALAGFSRTTAPERVRESRVLVSTIAARP